MTRWTIFGTHPLFSEYADAVHACGGIISSIVRNMDEPPQRAGDRYHGWLDKAGIRHRVEVLALDDFTPRDDEAFIFGFRGPRMLPLRDQLRKRHELKFPSLVHPAACVSPMAELGEGVFVGAVAVVASHAVIGDFSFINRAASIGHDSVAGPCVIIGPRAAIASGVRLGIGAIIGIGATVIENIEVGEGSYVGGGAVVVKHVPPGVLVAGIPAVEKKAFHRE